MEHCTLSKDHLTAAYQHFHMQIAVEHATKFRHAEKKPGITSAAAILAFAGPEVQHLTYIM